MSFSNPVRAFYLTISNNVEITPLAAAIGADNLPAANLVTPGIYNIFGAVVDMRQEGLYQISDFNGRSAQRISYSTNLDALLSGIAGLCQQGSADLPVSSGGAPWNQVALTRKVSTDCGGVSNMAIAILSGIGFAVREVNILKNGNYNSYDDGHTINEVGINGKWCAVDFDMKYDFWIAATGQRASVLDVYDNIQTPGAIIFRPLSTQPSATDATFGTPAIRYTWLMDHINTGNNLLSWYQTTWQMPYIFNSGTYNIMCDTPAKAAAATSFSGAMIPVSRATFLSLYYASAPPVYHPYHYGAAQNGTTGWGGAYTCIDRSTIIPANTLIATVGLALISSHPGTVYMIARENSPGNYDIVWSTSAFTHPGISYYDLPCGFTTPNDGATYRMGAAFNLPSSPPEAFANGAINRAQIAGVASGNGVTMSPQGDGTVCMRWS